MARRNAPPVAISIDAPRGPTLFAGTARRIFAIAFWTGLLSVMSLGIYRFWAKTRLRRYYWSSIQPGGLPLEYVGQPLEKLLGFLFAVTILAFYIGVVNLALMFVSYSLLANNYAAYLVSLIGVVPLWFYARYRARRYLLARTRFRGLRLGLAPGAWGYAWRALVHWTLSILTLGLLWPRMTFWLEKYKTDRTFLGGQRAHQGGHWTMLYPAMLHLVFPVAIFAVLIASVILSPGFDLQGDLFTGETKVAALADPLFWELLLIMPIWFVFGLANYRAMAFQRLTNTKSLGGVTFRANPQRWRIFKIYTLGNFLVYLALVVPLAILGIMLNLGQVIEVGTQVPQGVLVAFGLVSYFLVFTTWGALAHGLVTLPLIRHLANTVEIIGLDQIGTIQQRPRDAASQAEGFAEALDVGAAI